MANDSKEIYGIVRGAYGERGFNLNIDQFRGDMKDAGNRERLYGNLRKDVEGFRMSKEEFDAALGFGSETVKAGGGEPGVKTREGAAGSQTESPEWDGSGQMEMNDAVREVMKGYNDVARQWNEVVKANVNTGEKEGLAERKETTRNTFAKRAEFLRHFDELYREDGKARYKGMNDAKPAVVELMKDLRGREYATHDRKEYEVMDLSGVSDEELARIYGYVEEERKKAGEAKVKEDAAKGGVDASLEGLEVKSRRNPVTGQEVDYIADPTGKSGWKKEVRFGDRNPNVTTTYWRSPDGKLYSEQEVIGKVRDNGRIIGYSRGKGEAVWDAALEHIGEEKYNRDRKVVGERTAALRNEIEAEKAANGNNTDLMYASQFEYDSEDALKGQSKHDAKNNRWYESIGKHFEGFYRGAADIDNIPIAGGVNEAVRYAKVAEVALKMHDGEKLTKSEEILLQSYMNYLDAQMKIESQYGTAYRTGVGAGESAAFMTEMVLFDGVAKGVGKLSAKAGAKMLPKIIASMYGDYTMKKAGERVVVKGVENELARFGTRMAGSAVQTALMSTTYANLEKERARVALDEGRELNAKEYGKVIGESFIEVASESVANYPNEWVVGQVYKKLDGMGLKIFGELENSGRFMRYTQQALKSQPVEYIEEYEGAGAKMGLGYLLGDEQMVEDARQTFTRQGAADMFLSFMLPGAVSGGIYRGIAMHKARQFDKARAEVAVSMVGQDLSYADAMRQIGYTEQSENAGEFARRAQAMHQRIVQEEVGRGTSFDEAVEKADKVIGNYADRMAEYNENAMLTLDQWNAMSEEEKVMTKKSMEGVLARVRNGEVNQQIAAEVGEKYGVDVKRIINENENENEDENENGGLGKMSEVEQKAFAEYFQRAMANEIIEEKVAEAVSAIDRRADNNGNVHIVNVDGKDYHVVNEEGDMYVVEDEEGNRQQIAKSRTKEVSNKSIDEVKGEVAAEMRDKLPKIEKFKRGKNVAISDGRIGVVVDHRDEGVVVRREKTKNENSLNENENENYIEEVIPWAELEGKQTVEVLPGMVFDGMRVKGVYEAADGLRVMFEGAQAPMTMGQLGEMLEKAGLNLEEEIGKNNRLNENSFNENENEDENENREKLEKEIKDEIKALEKRFGVSVVIAESADEIDDGEVRRALSQDGMIVKGWFNKRSKAVGIYLPMINSVSEAKSIVFHEVVGHKGLRQLVGESAYIEICKRVYNEVMDEKERVRYERIATLGGVKGDEAVMIAAADEYMADVAGEVANTEQGEAVGKIEKLWQMIKEYLDVLFKGDAPLTRDEVVKMVVMSERMLENREQVLRDKENERRREKREKEKAERERKAAEEKAKREAYIKEKSKGKSKEWAEVFRAAVEQNNDNAITLLTGVDFANPVDGYELASEIISSYALPDKGTRKRKGIRLDSAKKETGMRSAREFVGGSLVFKNTDEAVTVGELGDMVEAFVSDKKTGVNFDLGGLDGIDYVIELILHSESLYDMTHVLDNNRIDQAWDLINAEKGMDERARQAEREARKEKRNKEHREEDAVEKAAIPAGEVAGTGADMDRSAMSEEERSLYDVLEGRFKPEMAFKIDVFHGSAADFENFDHKFMGSGAGSQFYGYGTYVSTSEETGKSYADVANASKKNNIIQENRGTIKSYARGAILKYINEYTFDKAKEKAIQDIDHALNYAKKETEEYKEINAIRSAVEDFNEDELETKVNRYLYQVEIPDDNGSNYLDWNGIVSKERVAKIGDKVIYEVLKDEESGYTENMKPQMMKDFGFDNECAGGDLYGAIQDALGSDRAASEFLNSIGYVGVKVPTGNNQGGDGRGMNYVIFNPADAKIVGNVMFKLEDESWYRGDKTEWDKMDDAQREIVMKAAEIMRGKPQFREGRGNKGESVVEYFKRFGEWRESKAGEYKRLTGDELPEIPRYVRGAMTVTEYMNAYAQWRYAYESVEAAGEWNEMFAEADKYSSRFIRRWYDSLRRIEVFYYSAKKAGLDVTSANNAYEDSMRRQARARYAIKQFRLQHIQPMMKSIAMVVEVLKGKDWSYAWQLINDPDAPEKHKREGKKISAMEMVQLYCQAMDIVEMEQIREAVVQKRAEANAVLEAAKKSGDKEAEAAAKAEVDRIDKELLERYPQRGRVGFEKQTGATPEEIIDFVNRAVDGKSLDAMWEKIRAVSNATFDYMIDAGYASEEQKGFIMGNRQFYVPERGFAYNEHLDETSMASPFDRAEGRISLAANPFIYLMEIADSAIQLSERNRAKQKMWNFLSDNRNWAYMQASGAAKMARVWTIRKFDEEGNFIGEELQFTAPTAEQEAHDALIRERVNEIQAEIDVLRNENENENENEERQKRIDKRNKEISIKIGDIYRLNQQKIVQKMVKNELLENDAIMEKIRQGLFSDLTEEEWRRLASGEIARSQAIMSKEDAVKHLVKVNVNGESYIMWFKDPGMATVLNGAKETGWIQGLDNLIRKMESERHERISNRKKMKFENLNEVILAPSKVTRFLSSLKTQFNWEFAYGNGLRDLQFAFIVNTIERGPRFAASVTKNGIAMMPMIARYLVSEETFSSKKWGSTKDAMKAKWIEEFLSSGAETGYSFMEPVSKRRAEYKAELEKMIKQLEKCSSAADVAKWMNEVQGNHTLMQNVSHTLEFMSQLSEMSTRMGQYVTERTLGKKNIEDAALSAKEVTTNFNRQGEIASVLGPFYMFFNATMQGTYRVVRSVYKDGNVQKKALKRLLIAKALYTALGFLQAVYFEDDPDEETYVPDYIWKTNMKIGKVIIPTPHFFRADYYMGTCLAKWLVMDEKSGGKALFDGMSNMMEEMVPANLALLTSWMEYNDENKVTGNIGIDTDGLMLLRSVTPAAIQPIVDVCINRNYLGAPVYKEPYINNGAPLNDVHMAFSNTPDYMIWFCGLLQDMTGKMQEEITGVPYRGWKDKKETKGVDINPSIPQYLLRSYGGGTPDMLFRIAMMPYMLTQDEFKMRNMPFVGRMYQEFDRDRMTTQYYWDVQNASARWATENKAVMKGEDERAKEYNRNSEYNQLNKRWNGREFREIKRKVEGNVTLTNEELEKLIEFRKEWYED